MLRCYKHVCARVIKDERGDSDLYLSAVVSHLLNCLLAPQPMVQALNSGQMRYQDDALQNEFQFFPEESLPSTRRQSQCAEQVEAAESAKETAAA